MAGRHVLGSGRKPADGYAQHTCPSAPTGVPQRPTQSGQRPGGVERSEAVVRPPS